MLRIAKWPGLLTAASPYVSPAGGSVEQINAQSSVPGQLTVRPGMKEATGTGLSGGSALLEVWGFSQGDSASDVVFAYTSSGSLVRITSITVQ